DRGHWVRHWISLYWTAGTGSPGIRVIWLDNSGHRVIWQGSGAPSQQVPTVCSSQLRMTVQAVGQTLGIRLTGQRALGSPGIRSFGSYSGTASSGKGSGSESDRHDSEHRGIRYRIVWLDSGN
ncbi:unnamed protein product, partial [Staurois parvus]